MVTHFLSFFLWEGPWARPCKSALEGYRTIESMRCSFEASLLLLRHLFPQVWAFATLGVRDDSLMESMRNRAMQPEVMEQFNAQDIALTWLSYARLQIVDVPFLEDLAAQSFRCGQAHPFFRAFASHCGILNTPSPLHHTALCSVAMEGSAGVSGLSGSSRCGGEWDAELGAVQWVAKCGVVRGAVGAGCDAF